MRASSCTILPALSGLSTLLRAPRQGSLVGMREPLADLRTLISRHAIAGKIATPMAGVRLIACSVPTEPIPSVAQPALAVVAQGAKRTVLGDQVFEYGAGQYL